MTDDVTVERTAFFARVALDRGLRSLDLALAAT